MTELDVKTAIPTTALADRLEKSSTALVPYLGALTPQRLDAPEVETGALVSGSAVHDLGWLRRIAVRGEDRFRWLSGIVTNAVESLPVSGDFGAGAYNLVLNAQGRIQGDCYVWRDGDELEIETTADQVEALTAHFDRFIVMDDVELETLTGQSALGITGPEADRICANMGLPLSPDGLSIIHGRVGGIPVRLCRCYGTAVAHYALWAAVEDISALWEAIVSAGARPVGAESVETLRILEGIPAYGVDIQSRDLAQETSQDRAISFTKGCYLGQEIVERIRSRGQVHRHLRSLELFPDGNLDLPTTGSELRLAGSQSDPKPAGNLTSITQLHRNGNRRIFAIGMVRAEAEVGSDPLTYAGGIARILNSTPKFIG